MRRRQFSLKSLFAATAIVAFALVVLPLAWRWVIVPFMEVTTRPYIRE